MLATCGGIGLLRPASGTWGSGAAVCCCALLELLGGGKESCALLAVAAFVLGVPSAQRYGDLTGRADHSNIVIDEFAAQAGVLVFAPMFFVPGSALDAKGLAGWAAGFVLFRLCDIVKPFPAGWIDRRWKNGCGVMLDDVVAGIWAVGFLWLLALLWGTGGIWEMEGYRFFL